MANRDKENDGLTGSSGGRGSESGSSRQTSPNRNRNDADKAVPRDRGAAETPGSKNPGEGSQRGTSGKSGSGSSRDSGYGSSSNR